MNLIKCLLLIVICFNFVLLTYQHTLYTRVFISCQTFLLISYEDTGTYVMNVGCFFFPIYQVPASSLLLKYKYLPYLFNTSFFHAYSVLVSLFTSVIPVFRLTCQKNHFIDVCNIITEHTISIKKKKPTL
jgi:hypothetical protein